MIPNRTLPLALAGLLLAVPLAQAQENRHPSGFEPKPVFEEDAPARKPYVAKPPTPPAAQPAPAMPPTPKQAARPHPPEAVARPQAPTPSETIREPAGDHRDPYHKPAPFHEDPPARKPYQGKPAQAQAPTAVPATPAPAVPQPKAPAVPVQPAAAQPEPPRERAPKPAPQAAVSDSSPLAGNYPVGLILAALASFVFWNVRKPGSAKPAAAIACPAIGTGVARYLRSLENAAKPEEQTGVARYLGRLASAGKPADS